MTGDAFLSCPIPISEYPRVLLAHGGGGTLTRQLIESLFVPAFDNPTLNARGDSAVLTIGNTALAFTTDSYVVHPLFFPGGDIGSLAVHGTVNDLAVSGARPLYLSAGLVIEEGLPMETLWRVVESMRNAAETAGVQIVTGDTKVVDKGKGDQIFINTSGVGEIEHAQRLSPGEIQSGDIVLVSGDIGRHGMSILAVREGLKFESEIVSDSAPLNDIVRKLLSTGIEVRCMRDLTRGGLATAVVEIAESAGRSIELDEAAVPVREDVRGACEILGMDPMYVANEGRFVTFVKASDAGRALNTLRAHPLGRGAAIIGTVGDDAQGLVTCQTSIGTTRVLDMISGEQLPRIC